MYSQYLTFIWHSSLITRMSCQARNGLIKKWMNNKICKLLRNKRKEKEMNVKLSNIELIKDVICSFLQMNLCSYKSPQKPTQKIRTLLRSTSILCRITKRHIFFFLFPFISLKTTKPFLFMIYVISCRANSDLNTTAPTTRSRFQKVNIWLECLVNFGPILSITTNNLTRSYWTNKRPNNMSNSSMMILFASH